MCYTHVRNLKFCEIVLGVLLCLGKTKFLKLIVIDDFYHNSTRQFISRDECYFC